MRKKIITFCLSLFLVSLLVMPVLVLAETPPCNPKTQDCYGINTAGTDPGAADISTSLGLGKKDVRQTVAQIINVALGLLGIVAVVIILIGGFEWMTAGGNEEKTGEAKKRILAGVIGLAIILAAYAIAKFVISSLQQATTGTAPVL